MLTESDLSQFYGTEQYFRHWTRKLLYTDGVQYVAEKGGAHWLIDAIASYQGDRRITGSSMLRDMQFWKLKKEGSSAVLTCRADSGHKPAITQKIEFTDFPLNEIEIWVERGGIPANNEQGYEEAMVAMLPGER
jgi:hypothetical protein